MNPIETTMLLLGAYFLGAVPFGVLVSRAKGVDIMETGSKNPGATNVYRTLGAKYGVLVFILDALKGVIPAVIGVQLSGQVWIGFLAGVFAVIGHSLSPFLKFKGGKGVATGFGALLGSVPLVAISAISVFFVIVAITRFVSLGAIIAAWSMVVFGFVFPVAQGMQIAFVLMAIFITIRHKENIKRLLNGTERKIGKEKKNSEPEELKERPVDKKSED